MTVPEDDDAVGAPRTLLITLTGTDRPGVTATVFRTLAVYGVQVLDIEQILLRGRLVLGVLVTAPRSWKTLRAAVEEVAAAMDLEVIVEKGVGDNRSRRGGRTHVTVLGTPLRAGAVAAIA